MQPMRSCVLYVRKSTDREDMQILSISAQQRELREFAARAGLTISQEFEEHCSARKPGRPIFGRLLEEIEAGRVERVLAWRLDRLARNPIDGGHLIYSLGDKKLKELVTPEGTYTGAGDSKFMLSVLFGAATKMTDDLAAGVHRGNKSLWEKGKISGRPPLGYVKSRAGLGLRGTGTVVPDPERFAILQRVWREMATGTRTVAFVWRRAVRDWGLTMRKTGGVSGRMPPQALFYKVLRNPFYMGVLRTPDGDFPAEHAAMVTPEDFKRVQAIIRREGTPRPSKHEFLYRGLFRCGNCQRAMVGDCVSKRSGRRFTYYRCGRQRVGYERCRTRSVPEGTLTTTIEANLCQIALPDEMLGWLRSAVDTWALEQEGQVAERITSLKLTLESVAAEKKRLTDLVVRGVLPEADYVKMRDDVQRRITDAEAALIDPEREVQRMRRLLCDALEGSVTLPELFKNGSTDERRDLLARVYCNRTVSDGIPRLDLAFPFTLIADAKALLQGSPERYCNPARTVDFLLNENKNAHS
jgi:DNA invertase Pin-like site-specific DNA recombinase